MQQNPNISYQIYGQFVEEQQTILDSLTTPKKYFNIDDLKKGQQSKIQQSEKHC